MFLKYVVYLPKFSSECLLFLIPSWQLADDGDLEMLLKVIPLEEITQGMGMTENRGGPGIQ